MSRFCQVPHFVSLKFIEGLTKSGPYSSRAVLCLIIDILEVA